MSRLIDIPIRVENGRAGADGATVGAGVSAILIEIAAQLERLADGGEPGAIDLRSLPMSPDDRQRLADALGRGEISITLQVDGESTIRETGMHGVWWTEYRDRAGECIADFLEIARVPAILPAETGELQGAARRLRVRAAGVPTGRANPGEPPP
jgi:hydrogenase-1 operon protein HyaF